MAYRFCVEVFDDDGQKVYDNQLLANNSCFDKEGLEQLGLTLNDEGLIYHSEAQTVDLNVLLEVFAEHYRKYKFTDDLLGMSGYELVMEGMFRTIPSYTVIGNYAIGYNDIHRLSCMKDVTAKVHFS